MRKTIFTLIIVLTTASASAQDKSKHVWEEIEPAVVEVLYDYCYVKDTLENRSETKLMFLRAGRTASMFVSPRKFDEDSLFIFDREKYWQKYPIEQFNKDINSHNPDLIQPFMRIFKNWPEGQVTEYNRFSMTKWTYSEPWEKPEWELCDSTKQVLGYDCQLAVSHFRGRTWLAWFTIDIPLSDGPWKLCGLPGLILEASDSKAHYSFTAKGLENATDRKVICYDSLKDNAFKLTRDQFFKSKYRSLHHSNVQSKLESMGLDIKVRPKQEANNYDLIETDYPHK